MCLALNKAEERLYSSTKFCKGEVMNKLQFEKNNYIFASWVVCLSVFLGMPTAIVSAQSQAILEEVVVTARKREESVQVTPISISAFSADRLESQGITKITKLQDLTPNLVFRNTPAYSGVGSNAAVFIRGIGQKDFAPTTEPGVGIYVDGVYLGRSVGSVFDMIDIERVEILRGPQGTLFGRNTTGGAISIVTKRPDENLSGKVDIKAGTDSRLDLRGMINLPLSESLFMRASLASFTQDGYVMRPFDGKDLGDQDNITGRLAFLWEASDSLTVNLALEYAEDKSNGPPVVTTRVDTVLQTPDSFATGHNAFAGGGNPFNCFAPGAGPDCYTNDTAVGGKYKNFGSGPNFSDLEMDGAALTLEWEGEHFTFKSITAVRSIEGAFAQDRDGAAQADGTPWFPGGPMRNPINHVYDTFEQDQFSQEFQLQGQALAEKLQWVAGLYYFEEDGANINPVDFFPVSVQSGGFFDYTSFAVFAQGTYDVSEQLSLTLGLRYTDDDRDYLPDQYFEELPLGPLGFPCFVPSFHIPCALGERVTPFETVNNSISETTPYVSFSYDFSDNVMGYVSYSEGYKSDGFTQRVFPPEPSLPKFEPEYVKSYEAGLKSSLLGGAMRLNMAVFNMDYTDLQLLVSDASRIGPYITNAGEATMRGLELELNWVPAADWRIDMGVGYLDSSYDTLNPGAAAAGLTLDSPFTLISDWNINASVDRTITLSGGSTLTPRLDWSWRSKFYSNSSGIPFRPPGIDEPMLQPDYHILNVSMNWQSADEQFTVSAGVQNLNDEEYRIFGDYQPGFGMDIEAFDRGQQWYVTLGYSF